MKVTIDPDSGFCFGVHHAIDEAERELRKSGILYCLGEIVHNESEVSRLTKLGLRIIDAEEFKNLKNCKVLIRAHGEPPETFLTARSNNIELIDATCPVVLKLQKKIRMACIEMEQKKGQVAIYGKEGHAEVRGLMGQTNGEALIIGGASDLDSIDFSRPVRLFSQTTMSRDGFKEIGDMIREKSLSEDKIGNVGFISEDTVCRHVSNRSAKLHEFASRFETVIFVSGKKSSNGMSLFEVCSKVNPMTYLVSGKEDLQKEWFSHSETTGICGATSTPAWLMEEIRDEILKFGK